MKNYVQRGDAITIPAPADTKSGDLVVLGALKGVAQTDALEGVSVAIVTEGVFELEIDATGDVMIGDVVSVDGVQVGIAIADASADLATSKATATVKLGTFFAASAGLGDGE